MSAVSWCHGGSGRANQENCESEKPRNCETILLLEKNALSWKFISTA